MASFLIPFQLIFIFLFFVSSHIVFSSSSSITSSMEAETLLKWKASFDNTNQTLLSSLWVRSNHCNWTGITCDTTTGSITHITLVNQSLIGTLENLNFFYFPNLIWFKLRNNSLYGPIPSHVGNLSKLNMLDLSYNNFSGNIPSEIGLLKSLVVFSLELNSLYGPIPSHIGNLSKLNMLDLSYNNFTGNIPSEIGLLKSLSFISLEANSINGSIPPEIGMLQSLTVLGLKDNMLSGQIPTHIQNLSKLTHLDLSSNSLSGALQIEIGIWNNSTDVDLSSNHLSGAIPDRVCDQNNDLRYLDLSHNQLEGELPHSLINCRELIMLNLADNKLNDTFPDWFGFLPKLRVLILQSNRFHGYIQDSSATSSFFKLVIVDLSRNEFTGEFPIKLFQNFKAQDKAAKYRHNVSDWYILQKTIKGHELVYTTIYFTLGIDLSVNRFYGDIPEEVGELRFLMTLNVSHNNLTGPIPPSLGNLVDLEALDLSFNKLSGRIPPQLTNMNSLAVVSFSNNNLVGPIPLDKQFNTFENYSYIGNLGLCGYPLSKRCCQDNTPGSYNCSYLEGFEDDGWKNGTGCKPRRDTFIILVVALVIGLSIGLLTLIAGVWWLCKLMKRRKKIKRQQKMFERNGGLLFQKKLSSNEGGLDKAKLFTSEELETATDRFNENRILGCGGQGTVYKGMLSDGRIVAIKKSKIVDEGYLEQFINEIAILSQIDHRNVVKLLGCCLETEVPLLVYEFIPNGTLANFIHDQDEEYPKSWDIRLRIAAEVSSAISYLHSSASVPIYHRDIKSSNILLDEKFQAKVSDFGTSRSVDIDKTHLTTQVRGTFGYLDPEYFRSSQFTEKSDVYSFGVVIAELLTGQKAISTIGPQEIRGLVSYFMSSMEENRVLDIVDPELVKNDQRDEVVAVAQLAKRCLNLDGRYRPTMKEVAMELERLRTRQGESIIPIDEPNSGESWDSASSSTEDYTNCSITSTPEPNVHPLIFDTV